MFVSASNFLTDVRRDLNDPKLFMSDKFREDISKHVTKYTIHKHKLLT